MAVFITALVFSRSACSEQRRYEFAVPAVAIMSLLPVYHRFCDSGLLLFALPWLIRKLSRQIDALGLCVFTIMGLLYFSWERRINLDRLSGAGQRLIEFLYYRGDALLVFTLAVVLVVAMFREAFADPERTAAR
jgi:hypothetical protein